MQNNLSLSIDIGGTSAKYAYVTADGRLTGKNSFSTSGLKNLDEFYQRLLPVIDEGFACGAVNALLRSSSSRCFSVRSLVRMA